jgi:hypothetical protein
MQRGRESFRPFLSKRLPTLCSPGNVLLEAGAQRVSPIGGKPPV